MTVEGFSTGFLREGEAQPFLVFEPSGEGSVPSPFFFVSDHAGRAVPQRLADMGVSPQDWERHIACDIGIREVGRLLQKKLDAVLVEQVYSRLVIDSNRCPSHPASIPPVSDKTIVPANQSISHQERKAREEAILHPYHQAIEETLERAISQKDGNIAFISLHSFTSEMNGYKRPWHIGFLHDHDPLSAGIMRNVLAGTFLQGAELCIGDNEPYKLCPANDYTVPYHAASRNLPSLEIEIRQDLIATPEGQNVWARCLAEALLRYWDLYQQNHKQ